MTSMQEHYLNLSCAPLGSHDELGLIIDFAIVEFKTRGLFFNYLHWDKGVVHKL